MQKKLSYEKIDLGLKMTLMAKLSEDIGIYSPRRFALGPYAGQRTPCRLRFQETGRTDWNRYVDPCS